MSAIDTLLQYVSREEEMIAMGLRYAKEHPEDWRDWHSVVSIGLGMFQIDYDCKIVFDEDWSFDMACKIVREYFVALKKAKDENNG